MLYQRWEKMPMPEVIKKNKTKMSSGIKKTLLAFMLILLVMAIVFNFKVNLLYHKSGSGSANIINWSFAQLSQVLTYKWIGLELSSSWSKVLFFFLTEAPYILVVMYIFTYLFSFARGFSTEKEISEWLQSKNGFVGRVVGALFGFVSPFCSCSTIPIVTSMAKANISFGTLISFLITSPMINESGIALIWSYFGYKIALIYIAFGFIVGIIGSYLATLFKLQDQIKISPNLALKEKGIKMMKLRISFSSLNKKGYKTANENIIKFWWILLLAMLIGSFMHGFIPESWIKANIRNNWWVPLFLVPFGALMYLNISATVPIVAGLHVSGIGLGPSLGFMMGINTLSLPEIFILSKLFKKKFIFFFVTYLITAILIFSYFIMAIPYGVIM